MTAHRKGVCVVAVFARDIAEARRRGRRKPARPKAIRCGSEPSPRNERVFDAGAQAWPDGRFGLRTRPRNRAARGAVRQGRGRRGGGDRPDGVGRRCALFRHVALVRPRSVRASPRRGASPRERNAFVISTKIGRLLRRPLKAGPIRDHGSAAATSRLCTTTATTG